MAESKSQGHSWISYAVSLLIVLLIAIHVFALVTLIIHLFFFTSSKPNLITSISLFQVYWIYRLATDNRSHQQQQQQEQQQVRRKAH